MKKFFLFLLIVPTMLVQAQTEITCAQARSYALSVSGNNVLYNDGETYVVQGYVTYIQTAWDSYWKNVSFWIADTEDGGKVIEAFRCSAETQADAPNVGSLVRVTGQLTKYGSTPEFAAKCTCEILTGSEDPVNLGPKTIAEFIALANTKDTCILTGVVTDIANTQYGNFYIEDNTGSVYVYGLANFSSYGIEEGDTVTVTGVYSLHGTNHEVVGARYISHVHPMPDVPQEDNVDFLTTITAGGWDALIGRTVTFSNDFVWCDTYSNTIAPYRLRDAEEYGEEGSAAYNAMKAQISRDSCHLYGFSINWQTYRPGTIIRGLKATVVATNRLQAVNSPQLINNDFPTECPDLGDANVVICGANVENFFVYDPSDPDNLSVQKDKIAKALYHINADIYALCEVELGAPASQFICDTLNALFGLPNLFAYTNGGSSLYQNSAGVTFIYRTDKIEKVGSYIYPYPSYQAMKWRMGIQCFKHKATDEKFNISMNHFWAKINHGDADREDNMTKLITYLPTAERNDPDVLVLGDLNAYTMETSNQMLITKKNYVDLLMKYAPDGYSHLYGYTVGYLDHAFCSPSMENQVTMAVPYHLNADTPKSKFGYTKGDHSMYRYSDHDPILVGLKLRGSEGLIENRASTESSVQKILSNGQIIIIRGGVEYTITGQIVK